MSEYDPYRQTGRTKQMLLRAILCFLEGNNVLISTSNSKYSRQLRMDATEILKVMHIEKLVYTEQSIIFNDQTMWFTQHSDLDDVKGVDFKGWRYFRDHYDAQRIAEFRKYFADKNYKPFHHSV